MFKPQPAQKEIKNENTSYSQIVTECRMRYAVQMLLMDNKNITQVAQLCGYSSTSYFISVLRRFTAWHRWIISPNSDKSDVVKGKAETDKTGINEEEMARPAGFEPAAHDLEGRCSIQLS